MGFIFRSNVEILQLPMQFTHIASPFLIHFCLTNCSQKAPIAGTMQSAQGANCSFLNGVGQCGGEKYWGRNALKVKHPVGLNDLWRNVLGAKRLRVGAGAAGGGGREVWGKWFVG